TGQRFARISPALRRSRDRFRHEAGQQVASAAGANHVADVEADTLYVERFRSIEVAGGSNAGAGTHGRSHTPKGRQWVFEKRQAKATGCILVAFNLSKCPVQLFAEKSGFRGTGGNTTRCGTTAGGRLHLCEEDSRSERASQHNIGSGIEP